MAENDRLVLVVAMNKSLSDANVGIINRVGDGAPDKLVRLDPRYSMPLGTLLELAVSEDDELRRSYGFRAQTWQIRNPNYLAVESVRRTQHERVTGAARCLSRATGKPVEVRVRFDNGHHALLFPELVRA